ncbi:MAG: STAS domain-containing protein [Acidimicrobiales bacterium]
MPEPRHVITITEQPGTPTETVITVAGDVDLKTAPALREQIEDTGTERVVIDLRDVRFMDSPGLGTLIFCHRKLEADGRRLYVRGAQNHVRDLMELTQAGHLLEE